MRELIQARDPSHAASIELALQVAGIRTELLPPRMIETSALRAGTRFLVSERDYTRALELVNGLQQTMPYEAPMTRPELTARIVVGIAVAALVLYAAWRMFT